MKKLKGAYVCLIIALLYLPIIVIMCYSINTTGNGSIFKYYGEIFKNKTLYTSILNSITVALFTTIISSVLGTFIAIGIHSLSKKKRKIVVMLNNIPMLNSEIVTGISIMIVCMIIANFIPNFFGFWTMLIAHVFFTLPYVILSVLPKLSEIDQNLYEAAVDLGCTPFKALWKIIIPAVETGIITGSLLAFTLSIDDFIISYFTSGNGFTNFSNYIYVRLSRKTFSPAAYAFNSLLTIIMLIAVLTPNLRRKKKWKRYCFY